MDPMLLQEETGVPRKNPAILARVKLDNTLLTYHQGNFGQGSARSRNPTLVTEVRHTWTTMDHQRSIVTLFQIHDARKLYLFIYLSLIHHGVAFHRAV